MDRPRIKPSRSHLWGARAVVLLGGTALCVTPVVALGAWLVMSDPVVAGDIVAEGDLWPLVRAIVETVSDAVRDLIALL